MRPKMKKKDGFEDNGVAPQKNNGLVSNPEYG